MLQKLIIKNYALIEDVQLNLKTGFTAITGETGAGKSILLGAIGLLLGKRADLSAIKNDANKCIIEGEFLIKAYKLKTLFQQLDLDYDAHTIIRREILPSGKSRLFINDTPAKLSQAQELGRHLIDIHSQHDTLSITQQDYQYQVLDAIAKSEKERQDYQVAFQNLNQLKQKLAKLKASQLEAQKNYDYNLFLLEELEALKLETINQAELEQQKHKLDNVEVLQEKLSTAYQLLSNEDLGLTNQLRQLQIELKTATQIDHSLSAVFERVNSSLIELEDIEQEVDKYLETVENDPELKSALEATLNDLHRLQTKHQVEDVSELIKIRNHLQEQVEASQNANLDLDEVNQEIATAELQLKQAAKRLFEKRKSVTELISTSIKKTLSNLGMPETKFSISAQYTGQFNLHGADEFHWLFTANAGHDMQAVSKVASGGELSRITLALKALLSKKQHLPSLIFDEIDTGVSGEIATKMADVMQEMGQRMQVIAITHLPQIASKGNEHFKVFKLKINQTTTSQIKNLTTQERIEELAEMLGGKSSTSAVSHAKSLLHQ
ncbi:DNA repair protein RecN [Psychroflexus sp. ALD_RP9]|uniref:DNA repair protein RecN n=1 Tax=Psychroflexus sp. ALD_RP9 TaxID=2777186 RepID=UPI001A8CF182|nr:DNA repair protein RecN [Psychroflexus sp. ALD_RP9]QSS96791.1 DNA repair protein RecN [Psychroflexus sp. ALD_RP9]